MQYIARAMLTHTELRTWLPRTVVEGRTQLDLNAVKTMTNYVNYLDHKKALEVGGDVDSESRLSLSHTHMHGHTCTHDDYNHINNKNCR